MDCELCRDEMALFGDDNAFVRYDNNSLSKGHILVVPRRHVADFFEMTWAEKTSILALLDRAKADISQEHSPDGYNIGVNIGKAAGNHACTSTYTSSHAISATLQTLAAEYVAFYRAGPTDNVRVRFGS